MGDRRSSHGTKASEFIGGQSGVRVTSRERSDSLRACCGRGRSDAQAARAANDRNLPVAFPAAVFHCLRLRALGRARIPELKAAAKRHGGPSRYRSSEFSDHAYDGAGVHAGGSGRVPIDPDRQNGTDHGPQARPPIRRPGRRRSFDPGEARQLLCVPRGLSWRRHPLRGPERAGGGAAAERRVSRGARRDRAWRNRRGDVRHRAGVSDRRACPVRPRDTPANGDGASRLTGPKFSHRGRHSCRSGHALGLSCRPSLAAGNGPLALRGMLTYNSLIAPFLAYLGVVECMGGQGLAVVASRRSACHRGALAREVVACRGSRDVASGWRRSISRPRSLMIVFGTRGER